MDINIETLETHAFFGIFLEVREWVRALWMGLQQGNKKEKEDGIDMVEKCKIVISFKETMLTLKFKLFLLLKCLMSWYWIPLCMLYAVNIIGE